ncbi:MAG: ATP-binding protein [Clostridia bacterium]|nr:ATP-binding protein [Clostridia bacterium]
MKRKIFLYYIILIIIGISVTGFFISELTQKFYKQEVENKLIDTASLIKDRVSEYISEKDDLDYNRIANKYAGLLINPDAAYSSEAIHSRITFIDFKGNVLGESEDDYHTMENHLNRLEIQQAVKGKTGKDIRHSKTLDVDYLYIAMPIKEYQIIVRVSVPLMMLKNIDKIIWYYTIIGILAALLLTTLLALKFSSSAIKPINELIAISNEISKGNYTKRVNIATKDEFGLLSKTFNDMAAKLEETVDNLIDKNVKFDSIMNSMINGIVAVDTKYRIILINDMAREMFNVKNEAEVLGHNILELVRNNQINAYVKKAVEQNTSLINEVIIGPPEDKVLRVYTNPIKPKDSEYSGLHEISGGIIFIQDITNIKKLEQIRTEFVSNVTHELKTPLTSIRGFVETLRSGAINNADVSEKFLEIIDIEAERLYMLINDILQLSEIENRQKDSNIEKHNLKSIVEEVLSILQGVAEKKGITVTDEIDSNITIIANKDRIKQMLINLIDNAIKYNSENGAVNVKSYRSEGKVVIIVSDTGIGIAQEHIPRIFERFYRVDKGRSRNMGGTGLGLSIVKHIVNLYNGDIRVNSNPGKGTEFIIQLPA